MRPWLRALALLLFMTDPVQPAEPVAWPTRGFALASPEAEGLDSKAGRPRQEFFRGDHGFVDSMLVVRHGRLVYERTYRHDYAARFDAKRDGAPGIYNYYDPDWHPYYKGTDLHTLQSVSKSVTSLLVGITIGRREIQSVEIEAVSLLKGFRASGDPRQAWMRLRHVLTMTTGIGWDESTVPYTDPANSCARMEASQDWVQFVLDQPMVVEPGQRFVYNSGATQLLSAMLAQATGRLPDDYAREHLFSPLGIDRFYWKRTPTGLPDTEGGLYLQPRDLAKLGLLLLADGLWDGRRILPEGWVRDSVARSVGVVDDPKKPYDYGFKWWLVPESPSRPRAILRRGYGGQSLLVVPSRDLVAVFTGWNVWERSALSAHFTLDRLNAAFLPEAAQARR
jgi:CubicO group peptidase (beta-lactamase class C family)